jgi:hypothetical protein
MWFRRDGKAQPRAGVLHEFAKHRQCLCYRIVVSQARVAALHNQ